MKNIKTINVHERLAYLIKHNAAFQKFYRIVVGNCIRALGLFIKTDKNLILFSSYGGKKYNDSPKVLFEAIQKDDRFYGYHYIWAFENPSSFQIPNAQTVKIDTLKYFITALQAKVWITNVNIERGLHFKKKETIYLNTWHGTEPKKGGNAVKGRGDYDFSNVDIFCCDGEYTKTAFVKYWNAKEENMIWCGRPREDRLSSFTTHDREKIRFQLKIPTEKAVILYMPTWRERERPEFNYTLWEEKLGEGFILCMRTHHFTSNDMGENYNESFFRDVTEYDDVNELYLAADILISDYSSAFFDYGLLGKPFFCYAPDYDQYSKEYGLFIDMKKEFPNGVFEKETVLLDAILNMNYKEECQKCKKYCDRYVSHPCNATQICLDALYKRL